MCSSDSFNPMNVESKLPVAPMGSVTPPAAEDRGSKVGILTDPIISTKAPQPFISDESRITPSVPSTPRHSTHSTSKIYTIQEVTYMEYSGSFVCAGFAVLGLYLVLVLSFKVYGLVKQWNFVERSSPLTYSKFLSDSKLGLANSS